MTHILVTKKQTQKSQLQGKTKQQQKQQDGTQFYPNIEPIFILNDTVSLYLMLF